MRFKPNEIVTIVVAGLALAGSVTTAFYTYANRSRELDIKLVEIGIGILRTDPKGSDISPARTWAIQVIEENSKVKFSDADREALRQKPLLYRPPAASTASPGRRQFVMRGIPEAEIDSVVKLQEATGGTIREKKKESDGTWTVVISSDD